MPVSADAILEDAQGRPTLRFERLLDHPPDRVWLALTQLDQLRRWHPSRVTDRSGVSWQRTLV
jgi:uncharacterized protein YndB with AHSA1/START domain